MREYPRTGADETGPRHRSVQRAQNTVLALLAVLAVGVALGVGVVGGYALGRTRFSVPRLSDLTGLLAPVASDPVAASLFAGALAVLVIPFGMYVVYQMFFLTDR